jgi:predicted DNA-binding transcriptional regulator AlpA
MTSNVLNLPTPAPRAHDDDPYLTLDEVMAELRIKRSALYELMSGEAPKLKSEKLFGVRRRVVRRSALNAYKARSST